MRDEMKTEKKIFFSFSPEMKSKMSVRRKACGESGGGVGAGKNKTKKKKIFISLSLSFIF